MNKFALTSSSSYRDKYVPYSMFQQNSEQGEVYYAYIAAFLLFIFSLVRVSVCVFASPRIPPFWPRLIKGKQQHQHAILHASNRSLDGEKSIGFVLVKLPLSIPSFSYVWLLLTTTTDVNAPLSDGFLSLSLVNTIPVSLTSISALATTLLYTAFAAWMLKQGLNPYIGALPVCVERERDIIMGLTIRHCTQ